MPANDARAFAVELAAFESHFDGDGTANAGYLGKGREFRDVNIDPLYGFLVGPGGNLILHKAGHCRQERDPQNIQFHSGTLYRLMPGNIAQMGQRLPLANSF